MPKKLAMFCATIAVDISLHHLNLPNLSYVVFIDFLFILMYE